ncbi:MAG: hypothetical protein K8R34_17010 [Methanosarcinales archaeon]|nr:hypothetical protein [Methanosarcinales archaeon]MCD4798434.1 hypothetical protein [Methanosarcinales archaeon]
MMVRDLCNAGEQRPVETLDSALNALESLRLSGRTIGVISHIDQLTRRIPVRIDVKRTGVGTSTIHVKG